jgi:hypothetical protein
LDFLIGALAVTLVGYLGMLGLLIAGHDIEDINDFLDG